MGRIAHELWSYIDALIAFWPGASGYAIRGWYARHRLGECGANTSIAPGCVFEAPGNIRFGNSVACGIRAFFAAEGGTIEIGDRVSFNTNVHINASGGKRIRIGNNVLIGPNVVLRSADHRFDRTDIPMREQGHAPYEIIIGDDVWVSANVTIVGGVEIGTGAVIAAGAVVTQNVGPSTVVGGVPARVLKTRDSAHAR